MGLLSPQDYADLVKQSAPAPVVPGAPPAPAPAPTAPAVAPTTPPGMVQPVVTQNEQTGGDTVRLHDNPYLDVAERLGPLAILGGVLGAPLGPIGIAGGAAAGAAIGSSIKYPDNWKDMSFIQKAGYVGSQAAVGTVRMALDLPKQFITAPARVALTTAQPWVSLAQGKGAGLTDLQNEKPLELPVLGAIPTYFQSYGDAVKSGMGPLAALLFTGSTAAGDVSILGGLGEASIKAFQPRSPVRTAIGEATIQDVAPVKEQILKSGEGKVTGMVRQDQGAASEYYSLPKTTAQQFGGRTNDTFLKITPASPDTVEVAVVQTRGGAIPQAVDWVKNKFGIPDKTYLSDFGPERKVQSQIVPINQSGENFAGEAPTGMIPSSATKGLESTRITGEQMANLGKIGEVNEIAPSIRDAVIRSVTGKSVMGEMTQAEYVRAAQTLGMFGGGKMTTAEPFLNPVSQYLSPQRRWMRTYEERGGAPLYSEVYVPMEDGIRARDVFSDIQMQKIRDIHGKYTGSGFSAERQAISQYMKGNTAAIEGNAAFTPEAQAEMIDVALKMRKWYDEVGPQLDVPAEIFLKDYQPGIQNVGGIYQLYKEGSELPKSIDFFAKFKKRGSFTAPQIEDSLALGDIYVNAGANAKFMKPVMERVGAFSEKLPGTLKGSVKSYVQEKMGYAGRLEQAADEMVPAINRRLGINLPPDAARQVADVALSTQYSGLLSQPVTWFRQMFQYPLFGYARLGPKFAREAYQTAFSKGGYQELMDKGLMVDLGYPYGGALVKDSASLGRVLNGYKTGTQKLISPNTYADNLQRAVVYHQFKFQFEDALGRYNAGKISWSQFEGEVGMSQFSPIDQNIARQRLAQGKVESAFDHLVRDVIDETQFPYRKASTARVGYGLGGKIATSLLQWPLEAGHTMGSWIKQAGRTGDFSKIIRYGAASYAIQRTFKDTFGVDFSRSLFAGPFVTSSIYSPAVQLGMNFFEALKAQVQSPQNRQVMNDNYDKVLATIGSAGVPAGVEAGNAMLFNKSITAGQDENGEWSVYDGKGELRYKTDFAGLFWGTLMGFPIDKKESDRNLLQDVRNAQFDRSQAKEQVMQLMQQEKFDEAAQLMSENGVTVTPQDMDNYYIPLTERTFQSLPAPLKAQFAPRVFPGMSQGVQ